MTRKADPHTPKHTKSQARRATAGAVYDADAARRAVAFFGAFLRHTKGAWAHEPFTLQPWQAKEIVSPLFGWRRPDGSRRYRSAYIEIPRKNGKSTLAAGLALYLLIADGEPGAEVYSAAADRDQARLVFEQAKAMVEESPALARHARIFRDAITIPRTRSTYKVLSADAYTKHGLNASGIIFDELHAQPNRELYDVLNTSTGARRQPLLCMITTAGYDRESICWEQHELSRAVLEDERAAPAHFAYIRAADDTDDWAIPATWAKANPGLDVTVSRAYLSEQANQAAMSPAYQNTFRRLHLNVWTAQDTRWLDMRAWDDCRTGPIDLAGRPCYGGLDLASSHDMAAFTLVFPPVEDGEPYHLRPFYFVPRAQLAERIRRDRVGYDAWISAGLVEATPGNVIDFATILARIKALGRVYQIREIAFDRWGALQISQELEGAGFTMVQFGQGYASMARPTSELGRMVQTREIAHDGNAVLRWNADNVTVEQDAAGNMKPSKRKSRDKIDGLVAAIMGLDRAIRNEGGPSIYEQRGLITL